MILWVQHGLVLAYSALTASIFYRYGKASLWQSFLIGFIISLIPRHVFYAHNILSEIPFTFLLVGCLFIFLYSLERKNPYFVILLGFLTLFAILFRPVALYLIMAFSMGYFISQKKHKKKNFALIYLISSLFFLFTYCGFNHLQRGFFGLTQKNDDIVFATTCELMDVEKIENKVVQDALIPVFERYPDRMDDISWVMFGGDGPLTAIRQLGLPEAEREELVKSLAWDTIKRHPFLYATRFIKRVGRYLYHGSARPFWLDNPGEYFVFEGLRLFWEATKEIPEARHYLVYQEKNHKEYFLERTNLTSYPFAGNPFVDFLLYPVARAGSFYPLVSFLLWIFSWIVVRKGGLQNMGSVIILIILGHLLLSSFGGFEGRYALPLEPLYILLLFFEANHLVPWVIGKIKTSSHQ